MNSYLFSKQAGAALICMLLLSVPCSLALAHGPDGDHQEPTAHASAQAGAARLEAQSELFELVALLNSTQLTILIDRYASNEPVFKAAVEVESGALKAKAVFQTESGDYLVKDAAMLKLLATPGEHALLITIVAGDETDLLDALLRVSAADAAGLDHDSQYGHSKAWLPSWAPWLGSAALILAPLGWAWRRKLKNSPKFAGEQA